MVSPILESTHFNTISSRVAYPVECLTVISNPNHKGISSAPVYLKILKPYPLRKEVRYLEMRQEISYRKAIIRQSVGFRM